MARTPFKMRSGNSTPFKKMGSSPVKQDKNIASTDTKGNKRVIEQMQKQKSDVLSPEDLQASKDTATTGLIEWARKANYGPRGNVSKQHIKEWKKDLKNKNITTRGKDLEDAHSRSSKRLRAHNWAEIEGGVKDAEKNIKYHTSEIKRKEGLAEAIKRAPKITPKQKKESKGTVKKSFTPNYPLGRKV